MPCLLKAHNEASNHVITGCSSRSPRLIIPAGIISGDSQAPMLGVSSLQCISSACALRGLPYSFLLLWEKRKVRCKYHARLSHKTGKRLEFLLNNFQSLRRRRYSSTWDRSGVEWDMNLNNAFCSSYSPWRKEGRGRSGLPAVKSPVFKLFWDQVHAGDLGGLGKTLGSSG